MGEPMSGPRIRTMSWVQALGEESAALWRDGRPVAASSRGDRMDMVAAISDITSASTPVSLPGGATAYGQGRHGKVRVVVEVPRAELDEFSRHTAVVVCATASKQHAYASQIVGALLSELRRLKQEGVIVGAADSAFERALYDIVDLQMWPPLLGRFSPAARRLRDAAELEGVDQ